MRQYTAEQRKRYVDQICEMVREWIGNEENDFELGVQRGVEWRPEMGSGDRRPRANPSLTLTLKINGGAHDTEGPPLVAAPPVFRPEG
ncbi:MAG TPA: hypothetical protein VFZ18_13400 [Longimicrobiaceae bacterium]|jgi:hypothetical protein